MLINAKWHILASLCVFRETEGGGGFLPLVVASIYRDSEVRNLFFVFPAFVRTSADRPPYVLPHF